MKCFYHPELDAVGTCKHCHRGLCMACAAQREGGLACRGRCEGAVDAVSALIGRNIQIATGSTWPVTLRMIVYWGVSAAMIYVAYIQQESVVRLIALGLAAITFAAGLTSARWLVRPRSTKPR